MSYRETVRAFGVVLLWYNLKSFVGILLPAKTAIVNHVELLNKYVFWMNSCEMTKFFLT